MIFLVVSLLFHFRGFVVVYKAVKDPEEDTTGGGWLGIVLGILFVVFSILGAGVFIVYNK